MKRNITNYSVQYITTFTNTSRVSGYLNENTFNALYTAINIHRDACKGDKDIASVYYGKPVKTVETEFAKEIGFTKFDR